MGSPCCLAWNSICCQCTLHASISRDVISSMSYQFRQCRDKRQTVNSHDFVYFSQFHLISWHTTPCAFWVNLSFCHYIVIEVLFKCNFTTARSFNFKFACKVFQMFVGPSNIIFWSLQGSFWSVGGVGNVILHILAATSIFFMPNHCQKKYPPNKKVSPL